MASLLRVFTASPIAMILTSVALGSVGQVLIKTGLSGDSSKAHTGISAVVGAIRSIANPWVFCGFLLYGLSSIVWIMILKRVNLSTAYPMISLSYVVVVILSAFILKEPVRWPTTGLGLALIVLGVSLIGLGLNKVGGR